MLSTHVQVTERENISDLLIAFLFGINFAPSNSSTHLHFFDYHTQLLIVIRQCSSQGVPYYAWLGYASSGGASLLNHLSIFLVPVYFWSVDLLGFFSLTSP